MLSNSQNQPLTRKQSPSKGLIWLNFSRLFWFVGCPGQIPTTTMPPREDQRQTTNKIKKTAGRMLELGSCLSVTPQQQAHLPSKSEVAVRRVLSRRPHVLFVPARLYSWGVRLDRGKFGMYEEGNYFSRASQICFWLILYRTSAHDIFVDLLMNRPEQNSTPTKL